MRTVAWVLALCLALVACSTAATPSPAQTVTPTVVVTASASPSTAQPASPSGGAIVSPLEGLWATGPIPIADIKTSMIAAGITARDVNAWISEQGSPSSFSFLLEFSGTTFHHSTETPDMPMQVDESGTFALSGHELVLTIGELGNIDTYTFQTTLAGDDLSLRWVSSTEQGTAQDKETHHRYTIALYCSAVFKRQP